eukprot:m.292691 g.292691  ORF g.292691 m.292691 type:complete len:523 (+) comp12658_c0_seq1:75-1643(+)
MKPRELALAATAVALVATAAVLIAAIEEGRRIELQEPLYPGEFGLQTHGHMWRELANFPQGDYRHWDSRPKSRAASSSKLAASSSGIPPSAPVEEAQAQQAAKEAGETSESQSQTAMSHGEELALTFRGRPIIGIAMFPALTTGWGQLVINLVLELHRDPTAPYPLLLLLGIKDHIKEAEIERICGRDILALLHEQDELLEPFRHDIRLEVPYPVIYSVPGAFYADPAAFHRVNASVRIGIVFFETTTLSPEEVRNAQTLHLIIAGSNQNKKTLLQHGLSNTVCIHQGIDTEFFSPAHRGQPRPDKFAIFSGGKIEFRKAQDVVLVAFREFAKKHADAVLFAAWGGDLDHLGSFKVRNIANGVPESSSREDLRAWADQNGLSRSNSVLYSTLGREDMRKLMLSSNIGLFPNRFEGGINMILVEAMATGLPCIASNITGQRDVVGPHTYNLQESMQIISYNGKYQGAEPSVEDILDRLEEAYANREEAKARGLQAASFVRSTFTWENYVKALRQAMQAIGSGW